MKQLPKELWNKYTYAIIEHGRAVCKAPTPICSKCILEKDCPKKGVEKSK
jgi:endonuclease-3